MRGFIVVLVLCGIYSSHSASVGFSESSPCANRADGSFLPVIDDCSGFLMCLKGETIRSSCGNTLHFDPVGKQCVEISMSACDAGKQVITSVSSEPKEEQAVVEVETKPQLVELEPQEAELKAPVKEVHVQQVPLKVVVNSQFEDVELQQVPQKLVVKPQAEEFELQQSPLEPGVQVQPEVVELQQVPLKVVLQPEEEQLLQVVPQSNPIEPEQPEAVAQTEEAKPQQKVALKDACTGLTIGSFIASRTNCHEYYVCLGNKMILKTCPNELHFNPEVRSCTVPFLAKCVAEPESAAELKEISAEHELIQPEGNVEVNEIPAEEKPLELETSEIVTVAADAMCSGKANGVMLPVPGSCTKFLACLQQDTYELSCGVGHFDPATNMCVPAKDSACVEEEVASELDVLVESADGNDDEQLTKTGVVSKVISATNNVASIETIATLIQTLIKDQSVGNANLGDSNTDESNTGVVSDANTELTSQDDEVKNTELGSSNSYTVSGGNLLVNDIIVPIKQSGLPVFKEEISTIDQLDIDISSPKIVVDADAESTVGSVEEGKASKGVSFDNANFNIDVNVVSDTQTSVVDNDSSNNVEGKRLSIPDDVEEKNTAVVVAVVDEESTRMCVGVPSGTLFPRIGNCEEFLTCESDIAYVAECPDGLHYSALLKACDWPESAGCV